MREHQTERDGTKSRCNCGTLGRGPDPQQSCVTGHRAAHRAGPIGRIGTRAHAFSLPDDYQRIL
jgi:hypothetical protein